jgi:hypothetical protein
LTQGKNKRIKDYDSYRSKENSHSQPPKSSGVNLLKVSSEDQNKLINILKCHTKETNKSLSPQRNIKSPTSHKKIKDKVFKDHSEVKPNGIRAAIDASKFFTKPKEKRANMSPSTPMSDMRFASSTPMSDIRFTSSPRFSDVDIKAAEIEVNPNHQDQNKQLLEFIQVVKKKFSAMETELDKTKTDLIYYKRKSDEQSEIIEDLRKRER